MIVRKIRIWIYIGGVVLLAAIAIFLIKLLFFKETLLQAATRILVGIESGNARVLMRYVSEEERKLAQLNTDKLQTILDKFVLPSMEGFKRLGEPKPIPSKGHGILILYQAYQHSDGRKTERTITVAESEEGIVATTLTRTLVLPTLATYWSSEKPFPYGMKKLEFFSNVIEKLAPTLRNAGLTGIVLTSGTNYTRTFYTWDELIHYYRGIIEKSTSRQANVQ